MSKDDGATSPLLDCGECMILGLLMMGDDGKAVDTASVLIDGSINSGHMGLADGVGSITAVGKESGEEDDAILSEQGVMGETGEDISGTTTVL